ncbi:hypothetical protein VNO78_12093 [Psophocarpus tetragonolobus]|uniref:DDE Tnp4 domain-containing protein n=1 Tax=Psophocarpus tetragonolobus TaxID=3891 RepID=A0AAN9SNC2_PSOTE
MMDSRKLAAMLSSLISQLLLLLLHILPSPAPFPNSLLPLLLFSNQLTTASATLSHSLSLERKSKSKSKSKAKSKSKSKSKGKRKRKSKSEYPSAPAPNNLHVLTPDSFRNSFMMSASSFQWLSGLLEPLLECRDPAHLPPLNLSPSLRLALGLSRLATGRDYPSIASLFSVPIPVATFCVKQLCRVLCTNFRFWVSFPPDPLPSFPSLPNCCGVLFSTRFHLLLPPSSLAAQFVVDSSSRILNVAAGFLASKSDSQILKSSTLFHDIQQGTLLTSPNDAAPFYLIADSHYPLLPWLITPYPNPPPGSLQASFNSAHLSMRLPALRTSASLRNWGVLSKPLSEDLKMAVAFVAACSILHNCLLMRDDFSALASSFPDSDPLPSDSPLDTHPDLPNPKALAFRDSLANKFTHLTNSPSS